MKRDVICPVLFSLAVGRRKGSGGGHGSQETQKPQKSQACDCTERSGECRRNSLPGREPRERRESLRAAGPLGHGTGAGEQAGQVRGVTQGRGGRPGQDWECCQTPTPGSPLHGFPAVRPQSRCLTSLSLGFLFCKNAATRSGRLPASLRGC